MTANLSRSDRVSALTELSELMPLYASKAAKFREDGLWEATNRTQFETPEMEDARHDLAQAYYNLASAADKYRTATRRAVDHLENPHA
jgi:hypothetical protein